MVAIVCFLASASGAVVGGVLYAALMQHSNAGETDAGIRLLAPPSPPPFVPQSELGREILYGRATVSAPVFASTNLTTAVDPWTTPGTTFELDAENETEDPPVVGEHPDYIFDKVERAQRLKAHREALQTTVRPVGL